jgi:4-diphosphocytidyl-2-C-methyl-D-erythritol kinase
VSTLSVFSPAKINLFLAITGRREDGFHNLVSLAAPLAWGDSLTLTPADRISLLCNDPNLALDESNLVFRAAAAFKSATGWLGGAEIRLEKNIPIGAGLGGGSSNAVATLKALNQLAGDIMDRNAMRKVAATLGSDCGLFVENSPVIMRGRGELTEKISEAEHVLLRGRRVLIFKPNFGVSTRWAYGQMAQDPGHYLRSDEAEARLEQWRNSDQPFDESHLYNNLEPVVFAKYPALPALHCILKERFDLCAMMSGSGSASFAYLRQETPVAQVEACILDALGPSAWVMSTRLA